VRDEVRVAVHGGFHAPPKVLDARTGRLLEDLIRCGRELGLSLSHRMSGGASDGNKLAAAGIPVVDSLGPVGAELHSDREFVRVSTLVERAKLVTVYLMKLGAGEVLPP
jgi:glutamate carboxypeptidase